MKNNLKNLRFVALFACIFILIFTSEVRAETENPIDINIKVDGNSVTVRGLDVGYENNKYVSLIDIYKIINKTPKSIKLKIDKNSVYILTNDYIAGIASGQITDITNPDDVLELINSPEIDREVSGYTDVQKQSFKNTPASLNYINCDNEERKYYTIITEIDGRYDCYISFCDLMMLLDMDIVNSEDDYIINTSGNMKPIDPLFLESDGYFHGLNSILVGDATTGEIFYEYNSDNVYPIASTTKLMTYYLVAKKLQDNATSIYDLVTISRESQELSRTSDGVVPMTEGMQVTVDELIKAALIASSNESDHALSEYVVGDEKTVVKLMNDTAISLGMNNSTFYNCNGLPIFSKSIVPAKLQNRMTSKDMFILASRILNDFPEIKEYTSAKFAHLDTLDKDIKNTNPLLYNMKEVNGLKTGTTNKSGACLVTSLTVNDGNMDHDLVVVMFGAEGSAERARSSELMARYGKDVIEGRANKVSTDKSMNLVENNLSAKWIVDKMVNGILAK